MKAREDTAPDGNTWDDRLQTHRVELNAMTTPQFIAWLDRKMAEQTAKGKSSISQCCLQPRRACAGANS